jgi:hypothetical protein
MWIGAGNSATVGPNFYHASTRGRYIGNTASSIIVGATFGAVAAVNATNNNLHNNTANIVIQYATGTTFNIDNEAFTPAVKLTPADVGLAAPDPLCPSGPQS